MVNTTIIDGSSITTQVYRRYEMKCCNILYGRMGLQLYIQKYTQISSKSHNIEKMIVGF